MCGHTVSTEEATCTTEAEDPLHDAEVERVATKVRQRQVRAADVFPGAHRVADRVIDLIGTEPLGAIEEIGRVADIREATAANVSLDEV